MKKYLTAATAFFFFLTSCEDHYGICNVSRAVYLQGDFYKISSGQEAAVTAPSLSMAYVSDGTSIYNNVTGQDKFRVLLSPVEDTMHYYIRFESGMPADTISVVYSTQPYNISEECGTISIYNINSIYSTRNTIDSVALTSGIVNNSSGQNMKLYF